MGGLLWKLLRQEKNGERLFFLYDATGLVGFDYITSNGTTTYYYRYDGKGEIAALTDAAGNVVAVYSYDAWDANTGMTDASGNAITSSTHISVISTRSGTRAITTILLHAKIRRSSL